MVVNGHFSGSDMAVINQHFSSFLYIDYPILNSLFYKLYSLIKKKMKARAIGLNI